MQAFTALTGRVLVLEQENIDTDQIIPGRFLTTTDFDGIGEHAFADWRFDPDGRLNEGHVLNQPRARECPVLVAGRNFGCGSSREHAVWVFEVNGINVIIAESFARIFRQNMFNCGMLAIELTKEDIESLFSLGSEVTIKVDMQHNLITAENEQGNSLSITFSLNEFDRQLVMAGGWLAYADQKY